MIRPADQEMTTIEKIDPRERDMPCYTMGGQEEAHKESLSSARRQGKRREID